MYKNIQNALNAYERIALEEEIQAEQIKNLPELGLRYQKILENEQYFRFLYSEDRVVEVIKDIERLAKEQNIALTITQKEIPKKKAPEKKEAPADAKQGEEKKQEAPKPKELADTLPYEKYIWLELKAEGEYRALRNFLQSLETAPYALDILALQGDVAPVAEEDRLVVSPSSNENPFLLSGDSVSEVRNDAVKTPNKVIFIMETALYIQ